MMTCSVHKQLTVSLAGVSMAVLYLSLHLAVFTGFARINQLMWRWSEVEYGIVSGKIVRPFLCEVSSLMWWGGGFV